MVLRLEYTPTTAIGDLPANSESAYVFVTGQTYRRTELHARYGGQRQGGISTPASEARKALLASIERGWEDWMTVWEPGARVSAQHGRIGEVWHTLRQMYAMLIVRDCFGGDLDEVEFQQLLGRAMGDVGEHQLFFNVEEIRDALRPYPERLSRLDHFLSSAEEKARPGGGPRFARLLQRYCLPVSAWRSCPQRTPRLTSL